MILGTNEVLELVKKPVSPVIGVNRDLQNRHKLHITGEGVDTHISHLIAYETAEDFKLRQKDVEDFTRLVTNEIIEAQSRWKSAQGTTKYYDFGSNGDKLATEFKKDILSQVWKGGSMDSFIKDFLAAAIYQEFNGFLLIEKGAILRMPIEGGEEVYEVREGISTRITDDKVKPYIVFKSVNDVHSFRVTGSRVEYIVLDAGFEMRNGLKVKLFRVIDDKFDYIVEVQGNESRISEMHPPIQHKAGKCPVVRVSTLRKYIANDMTLTSVIDNLLGTLDNLLTLYIDHATTARKHGFPLMWMVGSDCIGRNEYTTCDNGRLQWTWDGVDHDILCPSCGGKKQIKTDPSSVLLVPFTDIEGKAISMTAPGGYINRDIATFIEQRNEINFQIQSLLSAGTGVKNGMAEASTDKTATEVVMNTKPLEDIISKNIDIVESVEKELTDLLGVVYYGDKYKGCEIIYGRRLNLRDENALLMEIEASKKAGTSVMHIKTLNEELTYSRFIRSEIDLQRNILLSELEPLIGFTFSEIESSESIDYKTKILKQNFTDIVEEFEQKNGLIERYKPELEHKKRIKLIQDELNKILDAMDWNKVEEGELSQKQADAQADLRGTVGGVTGLIAINEAVSLGNMDEDTAITIIEQIYGYSREIAANMVTAPSDKPKPTNDFNNNKF